MKFIAYNTRLNIKTLINDTSEAIDSRRKEAKKVFEMNKSKLLPYVLTYWHYMVDLHNEIPPKRYAGWDNVRLLDLQGNTLNREEAFSKYTKDHLFSSTGEVYSLYDATPMGYKGAFHFFLREDGGVTIEAAGHKYSDVESLIAHIAQYWLGK